MKINASNGLEQYQKYAQAVKNGDSVVAKGKADEKAAAAQNTDKVTLSEAAAARAETSRIASALSAEVDSTVSAERLAQLSAQVNDGSYYVPTGALADAILGFNSKA